MLTEDMTMYFGGNNLTEIEIEAVQKVSSTKH